MFVNQDYTRLKFEKFSPAELQHLLKTKDVFLLDVRPEEFEESQDYLEGTLHCPLIDLERRLAEIPPDKPLVITDWAMKQSPVAAIYLTKKQYNVLGVLKGGVERWLQEGLTTGNHSAP